MAPNKNKKRQLTHRWIWFTVHCLFGRIGTGRPVPILQKNILYVSKKLYYSYYFKSTIPKIPACLTASSHIYRDRRQYAYVVILTHNPGQRMMHCTDLSHRHRHRWQLHSRSHTFFFLKIWIMCCRLQCEQMVKVQGKTFWSSTMSQLYAYYM